MSKHKSNPILEAIKKEIKRREKLERMSEELAAAQKEFADKVAAIADKYGESRTKMLADAIKCLIDVAVLLDFDKYNLKTGNIKWKDEEAEQDACCRADVSDCKRAENPSAADGGTSP